MSLENPLWGAERIRGELRKLGIEVSNRSIRRYRPPGPTRPPSQTWRTFLANHAHALWAADLCVVQTLTFKTLYVLLFIGHGRRELVHLAVTAHPTAAWVWRQLVEATPWGRRPKRLIRDRDAVYGGEFRARAAGLGIETILTPVRAPRANAVAERVIGTLRRECLDHLIPLDEQHLRTILAAYADYYNRDRPHRTLHLQSAASAGPPAHRTQPVDPFTAGPGRIAPRVRARRAGRRRRFAVLQQARQPCSVFRYDALVVPLQVGPADSGPCPPTETRADGRGPERANASSIAVASCANVWVPSGSEQAPRARPTVPAPPLHQVYPDRQPRAAGRLGSLGGEARRPRGGAALHARRRSASRHQSGASPRSRHHSRVRTAVSACAPDTAQNVQSSLAARV